MCLRRPLLATKNGLGGPLLAAKIGLGGPLLAAKIGLGWDHFWQGGTTFGCQKWSPGTSFGNQKWSPGTSFGNQKWSPGTSFGCQKWSGGPLLGGTTFGMTGHTISNVQMITVVWLTNNYAITNCRTKSCGGTSLVCSCPQTIRRCTV